jgi:hypothetical protein
MGAIAEAVECRAFSSAPAGARMLDSQFPVADATG